MEVILVRHTSVDIPRGTCYGQSDVPLKASFEQEAAAVKAELDKYGDIDYSFTSPLTRCTRLAEYCGYSNATRDARLMEINMGEWEMKRFDDITDPRLQEWYEDFINVQVTGGESFRMQYHRVSAFLNELRQKTWKRVAIFSHGGVLTCAQIYAGLIKPGEADIFQMPYGYITKIDL